MEHISLLTYLVDSCFKISPQLAQSDWAPDYPDQIQCSFHLSDVL